MKNYEEITRDLLERRDRYVADKRKKKNSITLLTAFCSFCLVVIAVFGLKDNDIRPAELTVLNDSSIIGEKDYIENSKTANNEPAKNNKIVVNELGNIQTNLQDIALMADDFIEMSLEEMKQYYGVDITPMVPEDITLWDDQRYGIYKRDGGTGEIYWDSVILNYSNEDYSRSVNIEVDKNVMPVLDYIYFGEIEKESQINDNEVMIGRTENGDYYAEFMYHSVGFVVNTSGISEAELIAILSSILD